MKKVNFLIVLILLLNSVVVYSQQQFKAIIDSASIANGVKVTDLHCYEILQIEERNNEIFVDINIYDDLGVTPFGHWLTNDEIKRYKQDVHSINAIINDYIIQRRKSKLTELIMERDSSYINQIKIELR